MKLQHAAAVIVKKAGVAAPAFKVNQITDKVLNGS